MAHIRELVGGRFKVCWRENARDEYGAPIVGKYVQRSETFTDVKAAERHKVAIDGSLELGQSPSDTRTAATRALGDYARDYFASLRGLIAERTVDGYVALYHVHIEPTLGNRPVASIRVADVKRLRSALLTSNGLNRKRQRSPKTVAQVLGVLRRILDTAVENEAIASNPATVVKARGTSAKQPPRPGGDSDGERMPVDYKPLTAEQIAAVADYVERVNASPVYGLAIKFAGFTGLRAAEVAGLTVGDLTLSGHKGTTGAVSVERTKTKRSGRWITDTPKSAKSIRTVPLDAWLADDVRDYLTNVHPNGGDDSAPLFPGRYSLRAAKLAGVDTRSTAARYNYSEPIDCSNVYKRYLAPAVKALRYQHSRWHDLRHSFAVMSLSNGEHYMQVSKWLGHSTFTLTLDVYGDYIAKYEGGKAAPLARPVAKPADNVVSLESKRA